MNLKFEVEIRSKILKLNFEVEVCSEGLMLKFEIDVVIKNWSKKLNFNSKVDMAKLA